MTLQLVSWLIDPAKGANVGIDNIYLKVERPPEWRATVKPMLNSGGLVHYAKGNGGVVLCNLKFQDTEAVPINQTKKRTILATVLRNLKAPFSGGKTVIAGANLVCTPIDIHTKATTYKDERGGFGDKRRTLKALPLRLGSFDALVKCVAEQTAAEHSNRPNPTQIMAEPSEEQKTPHRTAMGRSSSRTEPVKPEVTPPTRAGCSG